MTLLRRASDPTQRLGAIPLDLAFGHCPRLANETTAHPSGLHLVPQRRRRQPESGCRLSESQHLAQLRDSDDGRRMNDGPSRGDLINRHVSSDGVAGEMTVDDDADAVGGHRLASFALISARTSAASRLVALREPTMVELIAVSKTAKPSRLPGSFTMLYRAVVVVVVVVSICVI